MKSSSIRKVTQAYLIGFLIIFILLIATILVRNDATRTSVELAKITNIAGKQRMYSQRLVSLTLQYLNNNNDSLKVEIINNIHQMKESDKEIYEFSQKNKIAPILKIYNAGSSGLSNQIINFTDGIEKIISDKNNSNKRKELLLSITEKGNGIILNDLNQVVEKIIFLFQEKINYFDTIILYIRTLLFFTLLITTMFIFLFLSKIEQDIKREKRRLVDFEKTTATMINAVKDYAIFMLDVDGYIKTWSLGGEKIMSYKSDEVIGKHFSLFYTEEDKKNNHTKYELEQTIKNGSYHEEGWRIRKDGTQIWVDVYISTIYDEENKLLGFAKITKDMTETRKVELLKSEFISIISHELRTPLTSIRGALSLLVSGFGKSDPEKTLNLLKIADKNSERLLQLINDILDFEKVNENKMSFNFQIVNLSKLVEEAISVNETYAAQFDLKILLSGKISDCFVNVDPNRLIQVLSNLISNAVKFTSDKNPVRVLMSEHAEFVRVSIVNTGKGIPDSFRGKIFQRFSQADASSSRKKSGTGLGLSISKMLIEKMKGTVQFESVENHETVFYIDLPFVSKKIDENIKQYRLLVCEDDYDQGSYLKSILGQEGYHVDLCENAFTTIDALKKNKYDALLVDLILPDMTGIDLIRTVRETLCLKSIPIIVVSVVANETKNMISGSGLSVVDWIEKPIDFKRLELRLKEIFPINEKKKHILHIEDDQEIRDLTKNLLSEIVDIEYAENLNTARNFLNKKKYDLVVLDIGLPDGSGADLLPLIIKNCFPVLIFSQQGPSEKYERLVEKWLKKNETSPKELLETILNILKKR